MPKIKFARNKQWRKRQGLKVFKKQVLVESFGAMGRFFYSKTNTEGVSVPMTLEEISKHRHLIKFRNVRTYCSCRHCKGARYSRAAYRNEMRELINSEL